MNNLELSNKESLSRAFDGDALAMQVWLDKYALKGPDGTLIEKFPAMMHFRMASVLAEAEAKTPLASWWTRDKLSPYGKKRFARHHTAADFYALFEDFKQIVPGGSMMANLGNPGYGSTSNCFFVALEDDSMEAIFKVGAQLASIFKYRGGCGINITPLRPREAAVHNSAKSSSGAVSFTPLFSEIARVVGQDGRRAAMMISISSDHPDVLEFIGSKRELNMVTGANISVQMSKAFMDAVQTDSDYYLRWAPRVNTEIELEDIGLYRQALKSMNLPYNKLVYLEDENIYLKRVKAKEVFRKLVESAHASAEPGILFWGTTLDYSLSSYYPRYREQGTNPCGEIPLADKDACRLFAINLAGIDMNNLYAIAYEQTVIADLSIDVEDERIQAILDKIGNKNSIEYQLWNSIKQMAKDGRRIGCGVTGLFEEIARIKYRHKDLTDEQILHHVEHIFFTKMRAELDATIDMAILKGSFKGYDPEESSEMLGHIQYKFPEQYKKMKKFGRRNVSFSTIAPTGTISILTGTTSGIEPLFAPYYIRRRKVATDSEKVDHIDVDGEKFTNHYVVHRGLVKFAKSQGYDVNDPNINWEKIFNESPYKGYTAAEISTYMRLKIQSIAQAYITHSISSTLNLPENTTIDEVEEIFMKAFVLDLKGVTIYREGSRSGVLVSDKAETKVQFPQHDAPKRPNTLKGELHTVKAQGNTYAIIVGLLEGKPYEVFAALSNNYKPQIGTIVKVKRGIYRWVGADGSIIENLNTLSEFSTERLLTLTLSMLLRHGAKIPFVISVVKKADGNISSFTSAVCRVLSKYVQKEETGETCPDCGEKLIREAGCTKCTSCSYSICMIAYEVEN